jgi:ComF family protein
VGATTDRLAQPVAFSLHGTECELVGGRDDSGMGKDGMILGIVRAGVELLFPPVCPLCGCEQDAAVICSSCEQEILFPLEQLCRQCAHRRPTPAPDYPLPPCAVCRQHRWKFDRAIAVGTYAGPLRTAIVRMKHPGEQCLSFAIARLIPVPMHWGRRLLRGNNSAQVLCRGLSENLGLPFRSDVVQCRANARKQSLLSPRDRAANVQGIFSVAKPASVAGKHVGIVDDTMTTGSTVHEIASLLKKSGADRVTVFVAARAMTT